jgi:hypothetical protein
MEWSNVMKEDKNIYYYMQRHVDSKSTRRMKKCVAPNSIVGVCDFAQLQYLRMRLSLQFTIFGHTGPESGDDGNHRQGFVQNEKGNLRTILVEHHLDECTYSLAPKRYLSSRADHFVVAL